MHGFCMGGLYVYAASGLRPSNVQPCACASVSWPTVIVPDEHNTPRGTTRDRRRRREVSWSLPPRSVYAYVNVSLSAPGRVSDRPCAISNFEYGIVCLRQQHDVRVGHLRIRGVGIQGEAMIRKGGRGTRVRIDTGRCGLIHTRRRICLYTVCGFCVFAPLARSAKPKAPKAVPVAHDQTPLERDGGVTERVECVQSPILLRAHTRG